MRNLLLVTILLFSTSSFALDNLLNDKGRAWRIGSDQIKVTTSMLAANALATSNGIECGETCLMIMGNYLFSCMNSMFAADEGPETDKIIDAMEVSTLIAMCAASYK